MSLVAAARKLYKLLAPHGVVIGGICAMMHGVERFTRDVDLATDLDPETVLAKLAQAGLPSELHRGDPEDPLPWVIQGECDTIPFQILPAAVVGVDPTHPMIRVELGFATERDFIASKCLAGGQQDLHDVAVLALIRPDLLDVARHEADKHGVSDRLDGWLNDRRLLARYGSK